MGLLRTMLRAAWKRNNRPRVMTAPELVALLRRMQTDEATSGEWDYFQALELSDRRLEAIRKTVVPLYWPGFLPATDVALAAAIKKAERIAEADAPGTTYVS